MEVDNSNYTGFNPNTVIAVDWILYSRDFTAKFPANHVLSNNNSDSVLQTVREVLAQNTGIVNPAISTDVLLDQTLLTTLLRTLHCNWKPSILKEIMKGYCCSSTKQDEVAEAGGSGGLSLSICSVERAVFSAVDVLHALGRAPVLHDEQPSCKAIAIRATDHCIAGPDKHHLTNSDQTLQTEKLSKKRKFDDCCTSPLSTETSSKRRKKSDKQNEVFDATSANQHLKCIPSHLNSLEKGLILQELAYFASDEEQITISNLRKEIQFLGGKPSAGQLTSDDNDEISHCEVTSNIPTVTMPCISMQKRPLPTASTSKQHEVLPSVEQMVQPTTTRAINHQVTPRPSPYSGPVSMRRLLAFIHVVVKKIVPMDLFGSPSNRTNFLKAVRAVLTAGRFDEVYLQQLMLKVKITHCRWARGLGSSFNKNFVVAKMWLWLLQRVVLTIIRTFFYATETSKFNNMIVYFTKDIWCHLTDRALNELENKGSVLLSKSRGGNPVDTNTVKPRNTKVVGGTIPTRVRFIPKSSGLRPIYPVKSAGANKLQMLKMRLFLTLISKQYEGGSVTLGRRKSLVDVWKVYNNQLRLDGMAGSHLFVVKVDVTDAYGSVLHNVLMDVIDRFVETLPGIITFGVYSVVNVKGQHGKGRHYILLDEEGRPTEAIRKNGMPMDQINVPIQVNTRSIAEAVRSYVKHQYISAGVNRKYLVTKGIAQGGTISSELCELYYNAMYYMHWRTCEGPHELVLHSVDDFLFISPNKLSAEHFLKLSVKGVDQYNCSINPKKTLHNISDGDQPRPIRVPFNGVTFCSLSRQLMVSAAVITSYPVRYSLKINPGRQPGQFVAKRLLQVTLARLPDAVIHPLYTTVTGLLANVFRVGLMAGARLEALIVTLLCPRSSGTNRFLGTSVMVAGGQVWRRVARLWGGKSSSSPVAKDTVLLAYTEGVLSSLCLKRHMVLSGLVTSLRRLQQPIYRRLAPEQRHLMPGILTKPSILKEPTSSNRNVTQALGLKPPSSRRSPRSLKRSHHTPRSSPPDADYISYYTPFFLHNSPPTSSSTRVKWGNKVYKPK